MSNTTLTADVIAKIALPILDNELGFLKRMHRGHEAEWSSNVNGYKKGDTISIRRPADFTVRSGAAMSTQDVIEGKTALTIDQQKGVDFQFTSTDLTLNVEDMAERILKPAMINLANAIGEDVLAQMYQGTYNAVGTPGQTVNSFSDYILVPQRMAEMTVPMQDRTSVLSPTDYYGLVGSQTSLFSPGLVGSAYREGELGQLAGIETMMSQVTPTHTVGVATGTPLVNGASQTVTYDAAKNTWTQTLETDGWTNSTAGILKAGDVFTIADVCMVNAKTKATTGILQQFVVMSDADSGATTGPATLTISPPMITSGPHQTVNAAAADDAAITVLGTGGTAYRQNLAFHKGAMSMAFVPMEMPQAAYGGTRKSHKDISIRLIPTYDAANDISKWRMDVLYGRKLTDPRLSLRFYGVA